MTYLKLFFVAVLLPLSAVAYAEAPATARTCSLTIADGYVFPDFKLYADGQLVASHMKCYTAFEELAHMEAQLGCRVNWGAVKEEFRHNILHYIDYYDTYRAACLGYVTDVMRK